LTTGAEAAARAAAAADAKIDDNALLASASDGFEATCEGEDSSASADHTKRSHKQDN